MGWKGNGWAQLTRAQSRSACDGLVRAASRGSLLDIQLYKEMSHEDLKQVDPFSFLYLKVLYFSLRYTVFSTEV